MVAALPLSGRHSGEEARRDDQTSNQNFQIRHLPAQFILVGLALGTPWFFGGVQARVQAWLFVGVIAALLYWLVRQFGKRSADSVLPLACVPLLCALVLGAFQLVPLSPETGAFFSPGGARLRSELASEQTSSDGSVAASLGIAASDSHLPLTLYPASTRRDLALLVLAVAVFLLGGAFFKTPRAHIWLCGLLAGAGTALTFFGLVQQLTWNGLLYWTVTMTHGGAPFGPFVNRNNAGGFLNLCLAGALGFTVWALARTGPRAPVSGGARLREKRPWTTRAGDRLLESLASLNAFKIVAVSFTGFIVAGILCSLSRGSAVAMIGAAILTTIAALCARRGTVRLWGIWIAAMAGLTLVGWVGMSNPVKTRLATLFDQQEMSQVRVPHWRDGLKAAADFWQVGSGLGTYRYVYRPYQERLSEAWYRHAENQYLEVLLESGVVGLGMMLIMIVLVGMACWRLLRDDRDKRTFAFGIAGTFALTSQTIHAFFDFGVSIPANMILIALMFGAVSGRAANLTFKGVSSRLLALPRIQSLPTFVTTVLLVAALWGFLEVREVAAMETAMEQTRFEHTPGGSTPSELRSAIQTLDSAIARRRDDAEAHYRMATLWIYLYRTRAMEQLRGESAEALDETALWNVTSPVAIHGRAHQLTQQNLQSELENLRNQPVIEDHLPNALRHLILADRSCSLLPWVHLKMAELCGLITDPSSDQIHIERSQRLAPGDPDLLFVCGLLELQAGRVELACDSWRRSLTLSSRYLDKVLSLAGRELSFWHTVEMAIPASPDLLIRLAREKYLGEEHATIRGMLVNRAGALIEELDLPEDERYYLRGSLCTLKELYPEAIIDLSRATELRPYEAGWRYELAVLLKQEGRLDEAHEQAKTCARLDPNNNRYRELLIEVNYSRLTTLTDLE